jgi:hypothetical protein
MVNLILTDFQLDIIYKYGLVLNLVEVVVLYVLLVAAVDNIGLTIIVLNAIYMWTIFILIV